MLNMKIDGIDIQVEEGTSVLDACKQNDIDIPTLCYLKDVNEIGACRLCVVEIEGRAGLHTSCVLPASEGMSIITNSQKIRQNVYPVLEVLTVNFKTYLSNLESLIFVMKAKKLLQLLMTSHPPSLEILRNVFSVDVVLQCVMMFKTLVLSVPMIADLKQKLDLSLI